MMNTKSAAFDSRLVSVPTAGGDLSRLAGRDWPCQASCQRELEAVATDFFCVRRCSELAVMLLLHSGRKTSGKIQVV